MEFGLCIDNMLAIRVCASASESGRGEQTKGAFWYYKKRVQSALYTNVNRSRTSPT